MNTSDIEPIPSVIPAMWHDRALLAIETASPRLNRIGWTRRPWPAAPFEVPSVATAIACIEAGPVYRVGEPEVSSYRLKRLCEQWGNRVGLASYVGNGDFILAARYLGVWMRKLTGERCLLALRHQEGG